MVTMWTRPASTLGRMTDRERLLIFLLSDPESGRADVEIMRRLAIAAPVHRAGPKPVLRAS